MTTEDIKTSIIKMNFLVMIPKGMGLEITLACMQEVDSGRMDMRQFLLNFQLILKALENDEGKERRLIFGSEDLTRWIKYHEVEIHAARQYLWPVIPETTPA